MKKLFLVVAVFYSILIFAQKKPQIANKSFKIIQKECTLKKGIQLRLKRVFDDSRCPENVQCIWAGEVSVALIVYKNKKVIEEKTMTLNFKNFEENKKWFSEIYKMNVKGFEVLPTLKDGVLLNPKDYYMEIILI